MLLISVIFIPAFPLRRVAGGCSPRGGLEYLMVNNNFRMFFWLHTKTRPSKVGDVVTQTRSWMTSEPLFRGFSQQDLPRQSLVGHSEHTAEPIYL